jgi:mono/diheme cytochrome c family protein
MWRKWLKVAGIAAVVLALLAAGAVALAAWLGERKLNRSVEIRVVPVGYVRAPAALKLGKYLFESRGCAECHGADGRGIAFIDSPGGMYVKSPNITTGPGGVVSDYNEGDWVRAIRHGVNPAGHALLIMPSVDYNRMSDADLAALVAYTRSLPPVAGESTVIRLPTVVKALYGIGVIRDSAEKIDHRKPPSQPLAAAPTAQYGAYVANMCIGCHGASLSGGKIPGAPPDWPPAANLTPGAGSVMPTYDSAEKFVAMMRTGKRPDGAPVSKVMPFMTLRNINDTDLNAMYAYLKGMPPKKAGEP